MSKREKSTPIILIVDDHNDNREILKVLLLRSGFKVVEARNGLEAVMAATKEPPDLIIMDLAMPVMDGYAAIRLMRKLPRSFRVPVIACTGHGATHHALSIENGFDEFLTKPIDFDLLESAIDRLLKK